MKPIVVNLLRVLVVCSALSFQLSLAFAQVIAFTNPTPVASSMFGLSAAAVGNDRVLIGAPEGTGAVFLFSTNGSLLTTFTNPTPAGGDLFGYTVAALGTDRVLIGAWQNSKGAVQAGRAYLFSTNGALLVTFANPNPGDYDYFGYSLAAVGSDRVLIGALRDNVGATGNGAAYLFSANGALLTTLTNPVPADYDYFGYSVAAVGTDRLLIGSPYDNTGGTDAGAAYLFSTNGALLKTFANPKVTGYAFGFSVTAAGTDRVLIGTRYAGAAYLFSTNGALLTTITNPPLVPSESFASAMVGTDRVLVGAYLDDAGTNNAGAGYLLSTNGIMLAAFTNPTPAYNDLFGYSVAAVGSDWILIGSPQDDTGATNAGVAYLFNIAPSLTIRLMTTNTVAVSWPSPWVDWMLQENTNDVSSVNWSNAPGPIQDDGTNKVLIVNPPTGNRFYRLFKP